jgi:hypothetical protein
VRRAPGALKPSPPPPSQSFSGKPSSAPGLSAGILGLHHCSAPACRLRLWRVVATSQVKFSGKGTSTEEAEVRYSLPLKTEGAASQTDKRATQRLPCSGTRLTPGIRTTLACASSLRVAGHEGRLSTGPVLWYLDNTRRACCSISRDGNC